MTWCCTPWCGVRRLVYGIAPLRCGIPLFILSTHLTTVKKFLTKVTLGNKRLFGLTTRLSPSWSRNHGKRILRMHGASTIRENSECCYLATLFICILPGTPSLSVGAFSWGGSSRLNWSNGETPSQISQETGFSWGCKSCRVANQDNHHRGWYCVVWGDVCIANCVLYGVLAFDRWHISMSQFLFSFCRLHSV